MKRSLPIALGCAVVLATTPAVARSPVAGSWSGTMSPLGDAIDRYGLRMTISADGRSGSWRINVCGGKLVFLRSRGGMTYFRERVTYGRDVCNGGATDAVRRVDDGLYVRVSSAKGKDYNSAGTLRKR
jgi:hypothetical protein